MTCRVHDDERIAFAAGEETRLDDHVAQCDECQAILAELWAGELAHDLTEPVMTAVRFEQFLADVARTGGDLLARFAEAVLVYVAGRMPE